MSKSYDYHNFRYSLFVQTFVIETAREFLRRKYKIKSGMSYPEWQERLLKEHLDKYEEIRIAKEKKLKRKVEFNFDFVWIATEEVEKNVTPEITSLAKKFGVNESQLRVFILYNNIPKKLYPPHRVIYASLLRPIEESGAYIKVDPDLTKEEILEAFNEAKNKLAIIEELKPKAKSKRKDIGKNDILKSKIYLRIEKQIHELNKIKTSSDSTNVELENKLVEYAIENVVGDFLENKYPNLNDVQFDKKLAKYKKQFRNYYYQISKRYNLPTPKKINSILRLINQ